MTDKPSAPADADASFESLWPRVEPHTLLGRHKARSLHELVASVPPHLDVAECGVFRGGMTLMMALQSKNTWRKVWAFDSFEGLPEERIPSETCYYQPGALRADEFRARELLAANGVSERVLIRKGLFESTLDSPEIPALGLVHVDCDVYSSARTCIELLYGRLAPGGIMVFDDYFDLGGGVSAAVNEHLLRTGEILYAGPVEQAHIVKGRMPSDDPESYVGWRPRTDHPINQSVSFFGCEGTILPSSIVLDVSTIVRNREYLSDLAAGAAVPDLPGGSLSMAKEYAECLLRLCDCRRSGTSAEAAVIPGMPGATTLPKIRQYAERILQVCDYHQSVSFWSIYRS